MAVTTPSTRTAYVVASFAMAAVLVCTDAPARAEAPIGPVAAENIDRPEIDLRAFMPARVDLRTRGQRIFGARDAASSFDGYLEMLGDARNMAPRTLSRLAPEARDGGYLSGRGIVAFIEELSGLSLGSLVTLGSGIAAIGAGSAFFGLAGSSGGEIDRLGEEARRETRFDRYERDLGFSIGLVGAGLIATTLGVAMLADETDDATLEPSRTVAIRSVHVRPLMGGGFVSLRGTF